MSNPDYATFTYGSGSSTGGSMTTISMKSPVAEQLDALNVELTRLGDNTHKLLDALSMVLSSALTQAEPPEDETVPVDDGSAPLVQRLRASTKLAGQANREIEDIIRRTAL